MQQNTDEVNTTLHKPCLNDDVPCLIQDINTSIDKIELTLSKLKSSELLIDPLEKINNTLSTTPEGSLYEILFGALFSVLAAFVFNFLYWRLKERKEKLFARVNEAKVALEDFEINASNYWSCNYDKEKPQAYVIQEAKIKANHLILMSTFEKHIQPFVEPSQKKLSTKILSEIDGLFDISTGGDFESSSRMANPKTVSDIIKRCARIKTQLSNLGN